jgi:hypothetical protein
MKIQRAQVAAPDAKLRPFEREFIRRVAHRSEPVEKAVKLLDTGPGPEITLAEVLRPPVLEALLNEFAVMQAHLAVNSAQWRKLIRDAKNTLQEIILDKKTSAAARVNACKAVFDVLKTVDPSMLKEKDMVQDFDDAIESILAPTTATKAVN